MRGELIIGPELCRMNYVVESGSSCEKKKSTMVCRRVGVYIQWAKASKKLAPNTTNTMRRAAVGVHAARCVLLCTKNTVSICFPVWGKTFVTGWPGFWTLCCWNVALSFKLFVRDVPTIGLGVAHRVALLFFLDVNSRVAYCWLIVCIEFLKWGAQEKKRVHPYSSMRHSSL